MTVAVREDHIEMAEFLLKEGADVNFVDQDQRSVQKNITLVSKSNILSVNCLHLDLLLLLILPVDPH